MLRTLIIDDETRARESLRSLVERYCPALTIVGEADGVKTGLSALAECEPDLLFLDIQMGDGTGFDLLERFGPADFRVVFTTAYDDYAIKAFRFQAMDYLLKPIDVEDLIRAVERWRQEQERHTKSLLSAERLQHLVQFNDKAPTITVSTEEAMEFVAVHDLIRLESSGAYTHFVRTAGPPLLASKNLKQFEDLLLPHGFFRVHHSHLVNLHQLARFVKTEGGYLEMKNGDQVPLSRRRRDVFLQALESLP